MHFGVSACLPATVYPLVVGGAARGADRGQGEARDGERAVERQDREDRGH